MERVRAKLFADEAHKAGYTGRGVTAAVLDSGICRHPDYADRIVAFADYVNGRETCYDDAAHGSHVSGILGGDGRCSQGRYRGIAPQCSLIHLKVLDRQGRGNIEDILSAVDWTIRNRERYRIRILNISAGTAKGEMEETSETLVREVERAWDAGLVVVVAAGNMGPEPMSITAPGNSRKVITVGAADQFRHQAGNRNRDYSGCGPTQKCICKPELVAPGTGITSCSNGYFSGRYYAVKSGTSMAAPAVAGCIALLLEKEPNLTNVQVKMRLKEAAVDLGYPANRQGWGMPNLKKLLRM